MRASTSRAIVSTSRGSSGGVAMRVTTRAFHQVERIDEVVERVRRAHAVAHVEHAAGRAAGRRDRRRRPSRCAAPTSISASSTRCCTSDIVVVLIGSNTSASSPAPKSGRMTRSPRRGAEDDPDRLADVLLVGGGRDLAGRRARGGIRPADAEEGLARRSSRRPSAQPPISTVAAPADDRRAAAGRRPCAAPGGRR